MKQFKRIITLTALLLVAATLMTACAGSNFAGNGTTATPHETTTGSTFATPTDELEGIEWVLEPSVYADDILPVYGNCTDTNRCLDVNVRKKDNFYGLIGYDGQPIANNSFVEITYCEICDQLLVYFNSNYSEYLDESYATVSRHNSHGLSLNYYYWDITNNRLVGGVGEYPEIDVIDSAGLFVVEGAQAIEEYPYYQGNGTFGIVSNGVLIVPLEYENGRQFVNGFAALKKDGKWGYFNEMGENILPCIFDGCRLNPDVEMAPELVERLMLPFDFSEDCVAVSLNGLWGIYSKDGSVLVPCQFEATRPVNDGKFWVKYNGLWGVAKIAE